MNSVNGMTQYINSKQIEILHACDTQM